jgi:hypothetical protein
VNRSSKKLNHKAMWTKIRSNDLHETVLVERLQQTAKSQDWVSTLYLASAIAVLTFVSGFSLLDTLKITVLVVVQVFTGLLFQFHILPRTKVSYLQSVGTGFCFGVILSATFSIILRATPISGASFFAPILFLIVFSFFRKKYRFKLPQSKASDRKDINTIFAITLVCLSSIWWWLWIFSSAYLVYLVACRIWPNLSETKIFHRLTVVFGLVGSFAARPNTSSWWLFSFDQQYLQSVANTISKFGPWENSQFVGGTIDYHWFTLSWAGMMQSSAALPPMTSIAKVIPIFGLFFSCLLIWSCSRALQASMNNALLNLLVFALGSNLFNFFPAKYLASPTFIFSNVFLIAIIAITITSIDKSRNEIFLLTLLLCACIGGKLSTGFVAFSAIFIFVMIGGPNSLIKKISLISFVGTFGILTGVFFYIRSLLGNVPVPNNLKFSLPTLGGHSGIVSWDSSQPMMLLGSLIFLVAIVPLFSFLFLQEFRTRDTYLSVQFPLIFAVVFSVFLTLIFEHGGASQLYFILCGLTLVPILNSGIAQISIPEGDAREIINLRRNLILLLFVTLLSIITLSVPEFNIPWSTSEYRNTVIDKSFSSVVWILIPFAISIFASQRKYIRQLSVFLIILSSLLIGVFQRTDRFISNSFQKDEKSTSQMYSSELAKALDWISKNTDDYAIFATNRFCVLEIEPCMARWSLYSAYTQRRFFIEGYVYNFGYNTLPIGAQERLNTSTGFAESPSEFLVDKFVQSSVNFYLLDKSAPYNRSVDWSRFGIIKFQNNEVLLIEFR